MKHMAIVFRRIFTVLAIFLIPYAFNFWKNVGTGHAMREYVNNINIALVSQQEIDNAHRIATTVGVKHAVIMLLGFNITFFACLLLATYIAAPTETDDKLRNKIGLYTAFVFIGMTFLPFGLFKSNPYIQEMSISFAVAGMYWLILGGVPLGIALISRRVLIKKNGNHANQSNDPT